MTNKSESLQKLLRETAGVISAQPMVPSSPGVMVEDRALLCTGAAFVYQAAATLTPDQDLKKLAQDMITYGKDHILKKAEELDLDPSFVERIVLNSDSVHEDERRDRMSAYLLALADAAASSGRSGFANGI